MRYLYVLEAINVCIYSRYLTQETISFQTTQ